MFDGIIKLLNQIDGVMYYPVLIIILAAAGLYFSFRTRFVQLRLLRESCRLIMEKPADGQKVSSFQALIVSTASRVGTGNIVGVSTAICLGGPGACFWMWLMCIIGASSAFMESTLAQIYKKKDKDGGCFGGPAYYIEQALGKPFIAAIFCVFLIATYAFGFNLLCSYNLQSSFAVYSFYDQKTTPLIVGLILAVLVGFCLMGGGKRIIGITEKVVPFMGIAYVLISLIVIACNLGNIPQMFGQIIADVFDFRAIFGGLAGSCMVLFAFTTLLGNLYYVDNALIYLNKKRQPSKRFMTGFYIVCVLIIFAGAMMEMDVAWTLADLTMGGMTLINIPCCLLLSGQVIRALKDYEAQKKAGKDPEFRAEHIGLDAEKLSFWK